MELIDLIKYPFYFTIVGVLPAVLIGTLVGGVLGLDVKEKINPLRMIVLCIICGAVVHFLFIA
jgi:Na+/citrate or Na+/malate symporter